MDLPGAIVTRWITWIRLCDFDVRHVPGRQHSGPDGLSRRPNDDDDDNDDDYESVEECIDSDLGVNLVAIARASTPERFTKEGQNKKRNTRVAFAWVSMHE